MGFMRAALLAGIITFLLFVIIFLPASVAWWVIAERIPPQLIAPSDISGTPWNGSAVVSGQFVPTGEVTWDMQVTALVTGTVAADLTMRGPSHNLTAHIAWSSGQLEVSGVTGWVDAPAVNQRVESLGYQVSGTLDVNALAATVTNRWFTHLTGDIAWDGGKLSYTSARSNLLYHLPALVGSLHMDGTAAQIDVLEQAGTQPLLDLHLTPDGWARVSMRGRLFDLVEQPRPIQGAATDVMLELESQIWAQP